MLSNKEQNQVFRAQYMVCSATTVAYTVSYHEAIRFCKILYTLLAARMRILASLSVSRMEKKVFRLRSCFCRVSFPGERKLLLLQCFSTVISLFTWLKKNWSCSLAKLMQACSKLFFSKCSKPNISRIPTGCKKKKKKKRIWVTP